MRNTEYKLTTLQTLKKKKKEEEGERWKSEKNPICDGLIKAFFLKKEGCILHIQWKLKFHQVRLSSLKREVKNNNKKKPSWRKTHRGTKTKKERKGRCVSARGVWEEGPRGADTGQKWHFEGLRREETAQHTTRKHQRENVAQIKYLLFSESREKREGRCFFSLYVQLRLIG